MDPVYTFLFAVASHWVATMSGAIALGAALIQYWRNKRLSPVTWVAVGLACLFVASYQAWRDQNSAKVTALCQVGRYHHAQSERRKFITKNINDFYTQAQELIHRHVTVDTLPGWETDEAVFAGQMGEWFRKNMGPAAAAKAVDMNGPSYDFSPVAINQAHVGALNWLNKVSANLTALASNPEWDALAPVVTSDCPA
jgi:hypothetical protein